MECTHEDENTRVAWNGSFVAKFMTLFSKYKICSSFEA